MSLQVGSHLKSQRLPKCSFFAGWTMAPQLQRADSSREARVDALAWLTCVLSIPVISPLKPWWTGHDKRALSGETAPRGRCLQSRNRKIGLWIIRRPAESSGTQEREVSSAIDEVIEQQLCRQGYNSTRYLATSLQHAFWRKEESNEGMLATLGQCWDNVGRNLLSHSIV